ncbi:hypothetical protein PENSPDRAFT_568074 [Peniophora sp. CONT]|nr:hypothetical protein PENSPDRAFT_568074 [Peniophora sp. CONT]
MSSDPRFARLKTDPRFRKPKKQQSKVAVDDRFKSVFEDDKKKGKKGKAGASPRVDKYGRRVAETKEKDDLKRFYRLDESELPASGPDYARGEGLVESSSEEDEDDAGAPDVDDSDDEGVVTLGAPRSKLLLDDDAEIDLDEDNFEDLDAQAAAYSKTVDDAEEEEDDSARTRRLAVVNLDWDHVRAVHLLKIFDSVVSPAAGASSSKNSGPIVRGKVLSVRVYPSEFGKERMAREEREGPPVELFKKKRAVEDEEEVDAENIYETGDADEYDEDALRKYQLERLRYYYAVVECDTTQAASHIYNELNGTELERSANVFDMSFVPDGMEFDDEWRRDEATQSDLTSGYRALDFTTDALRHSKVKLTWDEDDPDRNRVTRRTLTKKEMEDGDFRAFIASGSESEVEEKAPRKGMERNKLRDLLLGGGGDTLPEGWGNSGFDAPGDGDDDVDMEVTFMPALSEKKDDELTTLEKYQQKMREKRKKRKEEWKEGQAERDESPAAAEGSSRKSKKAPKDDFFGDSGSEVEAETEEAPAKGKAKKGRKSKKGEEIEEVEERRPSTIEELSLVVTPDAIDNEPKHFDLKAVLRAEKGKKNKKGKRGKKGDEEADGEREVQEDFSIDVKDDRFAAVHEDYTFAIDPSNPHFKKTKSMSALLDERQKRQKKKRGHADGDEATVAAKGGSGDQSLQSLVESVKRKNSSHEGGIGKRRRT